MSTRREFIKKAAGAAAGVVFTGCNMPGIAHAQGARKQTVINGRRIKTIDIHAHCAIPEAVTLAGGDPKAVLAGTTRGSEEIFITVEQRLRAMDSQGIDVEVLSINPNWYRLERELVAEVVQLQNEKLAELCAAQPERFVAMASLSLQYPDLAVEQLETAVKKYNMRSAAIGGSVAGDSNSPMRNSTRCGRRPRNLACCCSSTRRARRNSPTATRATAGCRMRSAIRSTPRSRCRT